MCLVEIKVIFSWTNGCLKKAVCQHRWHQWKICMIVIVLIYIRMVILGYQQIITNLWLCLQIYNSFYCWEGDQLVLTIWNILFRFAVVWFSTPWICLSCLYFYALDLQLFVFFCKDIKINFDPLFFFLSNVLPNFLFFMTHIAVNWCIYEQWRIEHMIPRQELIVKKKSMSFYAKFLGKSEIFSLSISI